MNYSFLAGLTLKDTGRLKTPKANNPEGMRLRIFSGGSVYPSLELTEKFNLQYRSKDSEYQGNGLDIFDSTEWNPTASLPRMILIAAVPKTESKITLYGSCRYRTDGTPIGSVLTQGTICEELLDMVRSMGYLTDEQKYCDLEVVLEYPIKTEDNIAYVPKTIEKGKREGHKTYERRENITIYPLNTPENLEEMRKKAQTEEPSVTETTKV